MKQSILLTIAAAVMVATIGLLLPAADDAKVKEPEEASPVAKFMRAKLVNSQSVLEGLVTEDYDLIKDGAQRMIIMSKAAEWSIYPGEIYKQDSAEFADAAKELINRAKQKNIDGATLSYLKLTISCVNCHNHVRATKIATGEPIPKGLTDDHMLATLGAKLHAEPAAQ